MRLYEVCIELLIGEYSQCFTEYFIARTQKDADKLALQCLKGKAFHDKLRKDKHSDWYYAPTDEYALRIVSCNVVTVINHKNFKIMATNLSFDPEFYVMFQVHKDDQGILRFANGDEVKPAHGMTEKHYKTFQFYIDHLLGRHL